MALSCHLAHRSGSRALVPRPERPPPAAPVARSPSAPLEAGAALLEEGQNPLLKIAALPARALKPRLEVELGLERIVPRPPYRLLDRAVGLRRPLGEMRRARLPMRLEPLVAHAFPDHAPVARLPGADRLGKERGPHRLGQAHLPRQCPCAARVGHQPDPRERL